MRITLEYEGLVLKEIDSEAIASEIVIGRGQDCTWCVADKDPTVGRRHVSISRQGKDIVLKDLGSRNGTFYKGREIEKLEIKPGVHVTFGKCLLRAERGKKEAVKERRVPFIAVKTGRARGTRKDLTAPVMTIGSDPDSALMLLDDMLVSRHHSEISVREDGSCWIKDLNSSNGTKVNETALKPEQERMLRNGDRIDVAHVELRFSDGTEGQDSRVWLRLGIMAATVLAVVAVYAVYLQVRRPASHFIAEARALAAEQAFAEARDALREAENSRGIKRQAVNVQDLRRLIGLWESTLARWAEAQDILAKGDWVESSRALAALSGQKKDAWMWDPAGSGIDTQQEVERSKSLLDSFLTAQALMERSDANEAALAKHRDSLSAAVKDAPQPVPSYLVALYEAVRGGVESINALLADYQALGTALAGLDQWPPPMDAVTQRIEETYRNAERESLKKRAGQLLDPARGLSAALKSLNEALRLVHERQPAKALEIEVRLPPADLCSVDAGLSHARAEIAGFTEILRRQAATLASFLREAEASMAEAGECFQPGRHWRDAQVMEKVFGCDSLSLPYPARDRESPSGEFDRYLGSEEFFEYLRAGGDMAGSDLWSDAKFRPLLFRSADLVQEIDEMATFIDREERKEFMGGTMAERIAEMRQVLAARDEIVGSMVRIAEEDTGRRGLIAAGIAMRLSAKPDRLVVGGKKVADWMAETLKALRTDLMKVNTQYNYVSGGKQVEIRGQVLGRGLPGDPTVRRMWVIATGGQAE